MLVQWSDGDPNGEGVITFHDGSASKGRFKDGNRVGFTKFWWPNGDYMEVRCAAQGSCRALARTRCNGM